MRGRSWLLVLAVLFAAFVSSAQQSKQQKIQRILDITNPDAVVAEVVSQVDGMMKQIRPSPTPQQKNRMTAALDKIAKLSRERVQKLRPDLVKAYTETFSDEEIDGMLAFYETPAGKATVTKIPAINARMSGLIQAEINALGPEINKIAEDALKP
ncbi:MAG: DUF2059 domain-containing protein [Bryobacteraceae bacterium]